MCADVHVAASVSDYKYKRARIDSFSDIVALGLTCRKLIELLPLVICFQKNFDHNNRTRLSMLNGLAFLSTKSFFETEKKGSG